MNQILTIQKNKSKRKSNFSSGPIEIKNIVRFFSVAMIIFGLTLIGKGSYAMYKDAKASDKNSIPTVSYTRVNASAIIKIKSTNKITNFKYTWNNSEETVIPVEATSHEEEIPLLNENSTLNMTIEDETGRAIRYSKEFIIEGMDLGEASIEISKAKGQVKITARDDKKMAYIVYQINNDNPVRVDRTETEDKTMNYIIPLEPGQYKLKVTAYDTSNNFKVAEETDIRVSHKIDISFGVDQSRQVYIIVKNVDGIKDIEGSLNGQEFKFNDVNNTEVKIPVNPRKGKNTIRVHVTNVNSVTKERTEEFDY